jgi:peptide chain release factor 1
MILEKVKKIEEEYKKISDNLSNPEITANHQELQKLSKRQAELDDVIKKINKLKKVKEELRQSRDIIKNEQDKELIALAEEDIDSLEPEEKKIEKELEIELLPRDPNDANSAIIEIRAGVGGDEAELFAANLYRMYNRYAANKGFSAEIMNSNRSELGGFKEIVFEIKGEGAYGIFKYESGVHRVQRVPETEKSGRIHTSTATVAVLPEIKEVDIAINPSDIRVDVFRASGHGGQGVNTTDSAVRITHFASGIVATCQDERSQIKNRAKAMKVLQSKLFIKKQEEEASKRDKERRIQIGSGMRSEKIRTYNYPQDRITDHRIKLSLNNIEEVLNGNLEQLITKLKEEDQKLKMENLS